MSSADPYGAGEAHVRARERVDTAATERSRLRDEYEHAKGTRRELEADASLRAARDEVAARERWLHWVQEYDD